MASGGIAPHIPNFGIRCRSMVRFTSRNPLDRRLCGAQSRCDAEVKRKISAPTWNRTPVSQPAAQYWLSYRLIIKEYFVTSSMYKVGLQKWTHNGEVVTVHLHVSSAKLINRSWEDTAWEVCSSRWQWPCILRRVRSWVDLVRIPIES